ncbi:MAG: putative sulfate exporter family transporter, partial [Victivallales bacterium]|nr:putative sulfate exporter family transporter [Victivallales bacterium]
LNAKTHHIAIASITIFTLNAIALLVFPAVGHLLHLTQEQFGFWSALAIHDTSSVVGATMQYGKEALEVGTTVKLARALWIVPVTAFISLFVANRHHHHKSGQRKLVVRVPWFIPGFLMAAAIVALFPALHGPGAFLKELSTGIMITTLFLIGANLTRDKLRELGFKPVLMGICLWLFLSVLWGGLIYSGVVHCVR